MGLFDVAGTVLKTTAKCAATVALTGVQVVGGIVVTAACSSPKASASDKQQLSDMAKDANKTIQNWKNSMWK